VESDRVASPTPIVATQALNRHVPDVVSMLSIEDLVAGVESRRVSPSVLINEFAPEVRDRAMELCASISRMNRCVGECSANTVSLASCDRAYSSAIAVLSEKLVSGSLGSSLARQKERHGHRFDARFAVIGFIRTVRHEDVRRRWNKERGLLQRIQRADFLVGRQGYESVVRSVAAIASSATDREEQFADRLAAVRRLVECMGLADPSEGGVSDTLPGLRVTPEQLVVVLSVFYRDACDVAPAGDDTTPWLPRVRRDIRRMSAGGPAASPSVVSDEVLNRLIANAWTVLRLVLSVDSGTSSGESYWDRYFGRAYCVSRIVDSASDTGWASDDTPYLAG